MQQVKIVGGQQGLNRIVTNVNVMENPDVTDWVHQGDLLVTTAYAIRNDAYAQANLVSLLASKGLAGLLLKPKRYLDSIPQTMIEQAENLGFPLMELPIEASFSEIINEILTEILHFQTKYFRKSEEAHRLFMEVILKGGRIEDIVNTLAKLINNSVIVFDVNGTILAKNLVNWDEDSFNKVNIKSRNLQSEVIDLLESGVKYNKTKISSEPPLHEFRTPIIAKDYTCGYLSIWDNNRSLTSNDFIFIDRAMSISTLEILNEKSMLEIERRYRNEFLNDLLHEQDSDYDKHVLIERSRYFGWDLTKDYVSFVFNIEDKESAVLVNKNEHLIQQAKEKLFLHIQNCMVPDDKYIVGTKSNSIILFLAPPLSIKEKNLKKYFQRRADNLLESCLNIIKNFSISLGVGRQYPSIAGLHKSYSEALKALSIGKNFFGQNKVFYFDNLGVYRLLQQINDFNELESFYQETIQPLVLYDQHNKSELVNTLLMFFECNGNLKQVSKNLFIHYNTILHRMERISEILDINLDISENRINLAIGLKIWNILKEKHII